jgi:choline-sulfatase
LRLVAKAALVFIASVTAGSASCVRSQSLAPSPSEPERRAAAVPALDAGIAAKLDGSNAAAASDSAPRTRAERPAFPGPLSFLFITVDTFRPDLGYSGYPRPVSPNIDELASRSTVYERAYSISTYTAYAIPPMMASRYPSEMPRTDRHEVGYLRRNVFLAERLHDAGYRTAGAASHFLFSREFGWVAGIDKFVMTGAEGNAPPGAHIDARHSSRPLADAAIRFLENYLEHPGFSNFGSDPRALYDGEIAFTDHHIGRVLHALAASPAAGRTVVVLTGDHGEAFGEHGFQFHGREIWDEVVRVPLVIYVPGAEPRRVARRVSSVDLAPTVLDLAGVAADPDARGESLTPELFGGDLPPRPILLDQPRNPYYPPKRGFIEGAYKLHHMIESDTYHLFDLDRDPGETIDLADTDPTLLARVQRSYTAFTARITEFTPARTIAVSKDHP